MRPLAVLALALPLIAEAGPALELKKDLGGLAIKVETLEGASGGGQGTSSPAVHVANAGKVAAACDLYPEGGEAAHSSPPMRLEPGEAATVRVEGKSNGGTVHVTLKCRKA